MVEKKNRCGYIDFIRVFAIVLVILLHCICDYYNNTANCGTKTWYVLGFVNELCRVGVPLFFMISGYLLLRQEITDITGFYKHRILKIGIPFILYDIFYYFFFCHLNDVTPSFLDFFKSLFHAGSAYHLWFIYSILFLYLLMPFIQMILQKIGPRLAIFFLLLVVFHTTLRPFINTVAEGYIFVYLADDGFVGYLGYMILGYLLGIYQPSVKIKYAIYFVGLLFFVGVPLVSMYRVQNGGDFLFHGGYSLNHYVEAAAIFLLCKSCIKAVPSAVSRLSTVTFGAYFAHVFFVEVLKQLAWDASPMVLLSAYFLITLIASFLWGFVDQQITRLFSSCYKKIRGR
ncbi:MAG: acyltransferase family protein [Clostridia bacterium]|nr:acyltransferase family protein [Clostridia bacterium]